VTPFWLDALVVIEFLGFALGVWLLRLLETADGSPEAVAALVGGCPGSPPLLAPRNDDGGPRRPLRRYATALSRTACWSLVRGRHRWVRVLDDGSQGAVTC
jgi:hypothetical protein